MHKFVPANLRQKNSQPCSKDHHEIRIPIIGVTSVLVVFPIDFVSVNFVTVEHIQGNPGSS